MTRPYIQKKHIDPLLIHRIYDEKHLLKDKEEDLLVKVYYELTGKTNLFPNLPQCDVIKVYIEEKTNPQNYLYILGLDKEYEELSELSRELEINGLIDLHKEANAIINEMAKLKEVDILGEYFSKENKIVLYIQTIRNSAIHAIYLLEEETLSSVFVHEMMHAYLIGIMRGRRCRI